MPNHKYGWVKQPFDSRDLKYSVAKPLAGLPSSVDLRPNMPPIYDQGQLGSCHDDKTMVLTNEGWKLFNNLSGNELLASVDPVTSRMIFDKPARIVAKPYKGVMVCANRHKLNFKVTPDHKMVVRKWNEKNRTLDLSYQFIDAKDLGWYSGLINRVYWNGEHVDAYTLSGIPDAHQINHRDSSSVSMKGWMKFLGIYLAEGTALKEKNKIQIAASKEREKTYFRGVLADLGINALELKDRFTFCNKPMHNALKMLGLYGVKSYNKFIPEFVFNQSPENIRHFLEGHFMGDGSAQVMANSADTKAHYTSSPDLAEGIQRLIFMSGDMSGVSCRPPRNCKMKDGRIVRGKHNEYRVSVCENMNLSINKKSDIFYEEYDGMVYCAEVPTYHTLVTKRENCILVSGNCTAHGIARAFQYAEIKQGFTSIMPSRLFLYYNERMEEGTISQDAGAIIRDGIKACNIYGVADETLWPYDISKFTEEPPKIAYANAITDKIRYYASLDNSNLDSVKLCMSHGWPIIFGFQVYQSLENYTSGVIQLPNSGDECLGGHCVCTAGYDDADQSILVANSWGSSFGMSGYFKLSYSYFTSNLVSDLWMMRLK